jgi:glutamine synthetase
MNCFEYIWIDAQGQLRSKTKIIHGLISDLMTVFPQWTFDGSSTGQAEGFDSDVLLKAVCIAPDPFREHNSYLVLCETLNKDGTPHVTNHRAQCSKTAHTTIHHDFWFGIEQEYVIYQHNMPYGWSSFKDPGCGPKQGPYYCATGGDKAFGRCIVEEHLRMCQAAGLMICGINAEVMPSQWEFQIGAADALTVSDDLWLARYILNRVCETYGCWANLHPKPLPGWNGSGCHTNVSTGIMREDGGYDEIVDVCEKLGQYHDAHIAVYGDNNELRLTGDCETANIRAYSYGVAHRGCSVRIPLQVVTDKKGYLEDRRPASNMDPYLVTERLMRTIAIEDVD